jgi:hypothetical protein
MTSRRGAREGAQVRGLAATLLILAGALLAGCGSGSAGSPGQAPASPGTVQGSPPMLRLPETPPGSTATVDRAACRAQLHTGTRIADAAHLRRLGLAQFQLRSNDLQEVVEEATHVCPPQVVAPLKRSMLRLLAADDYLIACAPKRSCDPAKVRRLIDETVHLERRAVAQFG